MKCLICDGAMPAAPSWRSLFLNDLPDVACGRCKGRFERIAGRTCRCCGVEGEELCADCAVWETTDYRGMIKEGKALYKYNEAMQDYVYQFKFLQDVVLARVFAPEMHEELRRGKAAVVPIPVHPDRLRERTFAQVEALLEAAGIPFLSLLEKSAAVQGQKSKAERLAAAQLFFWNGAPVPKKIVLVDDVYTTGTTMRHAAKALTEAGAEEISLLSLVRS